MYDDRYMILDLVSGKWSANDEPEIADHVSQYPEDYVLWQRVSLNRKDRNR